MGDCLGHSLGDESLIWMRCYSTGLSQLNEMLGREGGGGCK